MSELTDICPDFSEWPERWMGTKEDLDYGKRLLAEGRLAKKTVKRHLSNLWLLGGEIIRDVSLHREYFSQACERLSKSVGPDGGRYCRHLDSESELRSFDSTCRKLHKYLEDNSG
jgi:hypothetical protein